MVEREILAKLALKDLGNPAYVTTMTDAELSKANGKHYMGMLIGRASTVIKRTDPKTDEEREGLAGTFIMRPSKEGEAEKESGLLWIPDAFHNLVAGKLVEAQKTDPQANIEFAFDVSSIKATNPRGYSWQFIPAVPFEGKHPLDDMISRITAQKSKTIEAPKHNQAAKAK